MKVGARPKQASFYLLAAFFAGPLDLAGAAWAVQRLPADVAEFHFSDCEAACFVGAMATARRDQWGQLRRARLPRVFALRFCGGNRRSLSLGGRRIQRVGGFCFGFLFWLSVLAIGDGIAGSEDR